jgi:hypothetical protein
VKSFKTRVFLFLFLGIPALMMNSCFEIVEEVNLNSDGSGSFCFTINLSQSKLQINSLFLLDSINGKPMPKKSYLMETLDKVEVSLKQESELSEIIIKKNWEEYIFSINGNFSNIKALNRAINKIYKMLDDAETPTFAEKNNFDFSNKVFSRLYEYNLENDYKKLDEKDKIVFEKANYTTIYRFPFMVGTFSNPEAKISKSGKAIMLKQNIKDLLTNTKTIKNSINLK